MRSYYTNLEQSRKLLEILPPESADMFYTIIDQGFYLEVKQGLEPSKDDIPCWSLAALMDSLPNNEHISTTISRGGWSIEPIDYMPNTWWCEYEDNEDYTELSTSADNQIDACYEMIIKLHERKLL